MRSRESRLRDCCRWPSFLPPTPRRGLARWCAWGASWSAWRPRDRLRGSWKGTCSWSTGLRWTWRTGTRSRRAFGSSGIPGVWGGPPARGGRRPVRLHPRLWRVGEGTAGSASDSGTARPARRWWWCPAGSFMMGSPESSAEARGDERPQHRVTIGYAFAVGVYEVTFAEWDACVNGGGCGGSSPSDYARDGDHNPVTQVNWEDAVRPVTGTSTPGSVSPGPSIDYAARCLDETGRRIGAWMKAHRARQSTKSV